MNLEELVIRASEPADEAGILSIAAHIDLFSPEEVACVKELWVDYQTNGPEGDGYNFLSAFEAGTLVGFACFGKRPLTESSFDFYWLGIEPSRQHQGAGSLLMQAVEEAVQARGGHILLIETSGEAAYTPTRRFYEKRGYKKEADIADFYKPGDSLVLYSKTFSPHAG